MALHGWIPRAWHPHWTGLSLALGNGVACVLLLARARKRPEERRGFNLLALSLVPAIASNITLSRFTAPDWLTLEGPVGVFTSLQILSVFLQVLAVAALPWRAQPHRPSLPTRALTLLGSVLFPLSLLMVLDLLGQWRDGHGVAPGALAVLFTASLRSSTVGGILAYRIAQRPERVQGAAFWLLTFTALSAFLTSVVYSASTIIEHRIVAPPSGIVVALPLALALAGLDPRPIEPVPDSASGPFLAYALLLVPFFGGSIFYLAVRAPKLAALPLPVVVFLLQAAILGVLLILALGEVERARARLEAKVLERTRALEVFQALALRTERLNSVAVLGSGAVHNLNNLHVAIRAGVDTLELLHARNAPLDPRVLQGIRSATDQATHLTQSLLAYSHPRVDSPPVTDLTSVVRTMTAFLAQLLPSSLRLVVEAGDQAAPVRLPREHAEQILLNLVMNARDALDALDRSGTISVGLTLQEGCAVLSVADNGRGIPPGIQGRVFEPLFSTKADGSGLGLPSVKGYVENAGGTVSLESAPDRGSCFCVALPLAE